MTEQTKTPDEILTLYADGPRLLEAALQGLTESQLDLALSADSWSIRQLVHHLADGDDLWNVCIMAALGNPEGLFTLQWYWDREQMEWSESWNYAGRPIESSLMLLRANRRHTLDLLQPISSGWEKSIRLQRPEGQEARITIGEVIEMQARHVVTHIKDIQAIRLAHAV